MPSGSAVEWISVAGSGSASGPGLGSGSASGQGLGYGSASGLGLLAVEQQQQQQQGQEEGTKDRESVVETVVGHRKVPLRRRSFRVHYIP